MRRPLEDLLIQATYELESLLDQREPYYKQDCPEDDAEKLIKEIRNHPIIIEVMKKEERLDKLIKHLFDGTLCIHCGKTFEISQSKRMHKKDCHGILPDGQFIKDYKERLCQWCDSFKRNPLGQCLECGKFPQPKGVINEAS